MQNAYCEEHFSSGTGNPAGLREHMDTEKEADAEVVRKGNSGHPRTSGILKEDPTLYVPIIHGMLGVIILLYGALILVL